MRILLTLAACALASTTVCAQYKKASFMQKSGRTYELTARGSFISKSDCFQPAVAISFGREKGDSRFFSWSDLELVLPANFSYNTTYYDAYSQAENREIPVKVKAKATTGFLFRFNLGYYLLDNSNEKNIVLPFINVGANTLLHKGIGNNSYQTEPNIGSEPLTKEPANQMVLGLGVNAGVGVVVRINKWLGVKATGGYSLQGSTDEVDNGVNASGYTYSHYRSHPYASFGLRFRIATEE